MSSRTCASCGKFVPDDYLPEEGLIVRDCEDCAKLRRSLGLTSPEKKASHGTILIEVEGEAVIRVEGDGVRIEQ